jgi:hypothetical protein
MSRRTRSAAIRPVKRPTGAIEPAIARVHKAVWPSRILSILALSLLFAILLVSAVLAIGIAPGHVDLLFEPGSEQRVTLKLLNQEKEEMQVVLYAQGELAPYISFDTTNIVFSPAETEKYAYYTIKTPSKFDRQGTHTANIVALAMPISGNSEGVGMGANVAIVSKLNLIVPYSGKYAELTLFSPNFEEGMPSNFAVEVRNLGTEDLFSGQVVIDIYGPTNSKIATLTGDSFQLASKQSMVVAIDWTPDIGPGNYRAVASLVFDGGNAKDEKAFSIGQFAIEIADITVRDFKLGGIAMFDILLENRWNERIPGVYGVVEVRDEAGKTYTQFKTASVDIGSKEKNTIQAYWDTKSVGPGKYKLDIVLNYLGKQSEKIFDIRVSADKIDTSLGGMAVTETAQAKEPVLQGIYILTFLVIVLIVINVLMFLRKSKKKDK